MRMCKWFFKDATKIQNGRQKLTPNFFCGHKNSKKKIGNYLNFTITFPTSDFLKVLLKFKMVVMDKLHIFLWVQNWNLKWPPQIDFLYICERKKSNLIYVRGWYRTSGLLLYVYLLEWSLHFKNVFFWTPSDGLSCSSSNIANLHIQHGCHGLICIFIIQGRFKHSPVSNIYPIFAIFFWTPSDGLSWLSLKTSYFAYSTWPPCAYLHIQDHCKRPSRQYSSKKYSS